MYLRASKYPVFNSDVMSVQQKLNVVRTRVHGNWPYLSVDGLFGEQTKRAVAAFQVFRGITPAVGDIGDTTLGYVNEEYKYVPKLSAMSIPHNEVGRLEDRKLVFMKFVSGFANTINDISDWLENQLIYYKSNTFASRDIDKLFSGVFDRASVKDAKKQIEEFFFKEIEREAKGNTNLRPSKVNYEKIRRVGIAQSQVAKGRLNTQSMAKVDNAYAQKLLGKIIEELESSNFRNNITKALNAKGITMIRGGGILTTISLFPLFYNVYKLIVAYWKGESTEILLLNVASDLIEMLEGILIGIISLFITTALGFVGGPAVVVTLVASIMMGLVLSLLFPDYKDTVVEKLSECVKRVSAIYKSEIQHALSRRL